MSQKQKRQLSNFPSQSSYTEFSPDEEIESLLNKLQLPKLVIKLCDWNDRLQLYVMRSTFVYLYASSAVHSDCVVGFESAITMGIYTEQPDSTSSSSMGQLSVLQMILLCKAKK